MATPLDSLAQYIATDLALGALGTVVFEDHMPDSPDTAICVYDTGGLPPGLSVGVGTNTVDYPAFQVRSRSLDAATALGNMTTIYNALHGQTETTIHGTHFHLLYAKQSNPIPLGRDPKQRFEFTLNFGSIVTGVAR